MGGLAGGFHQPVKHARNPILTPKTELENLEAAVLLVSLGLAPKAGSEISGDIGFISSAVAGRINSARTYWSNQASNLVNDEPQESWLFPAS